MKKKMVLDKVFVRLAVLVTIPLMVMGMISWMTYIRQESEKNNMTVELYTEEISGEYEQLLSMIKRYYMEFSASEGFRRLIQQKAIPYHMPAQLREAQNGMKGNSLIDGFVEDYEFMNLSQGWILNNYGLFPYGDLKNKEQTEEFLKIQGENLLSVYWIGGMETEAPYNRSQRISNTVDCSGFRLIVKNQEEKGGISWILSVKINEKQLRRMISSRQALGYEFSIIHGDRILLETSQDMTAVYLQNRDSGNGIYYNPKTSIKYNLNWKDGGISGLTYVVGFDTGRIKKDASFFLWLAAGMTAGFIFILILVRLTAKAVSVRLTNLELSARNKSRQVRELLLVNMIQNSFDEEKIQEALKDMEIPCCRSYRMAAVVCKSASQEEKMGELYPEIGNGLPEDIRRQLFLTSVCYQEKLIFVIGAEDDEEVDLKTSVVYKEIKDFIEVQFGFATSAGISKVFHGLRHVRRAYDECAKVLYDSSNQTNTEESTLVLYDDCLAQGKETNIYDLILEEELVHAVRKGEESYCPHLLEVILGRMEAREVVGVTRTFYLMKLLTSITSIPVENKISLSEIFGEEQYDILSSITQIHDKDRQIKKITENMIHPIIAALESQEKENNDSEIITQLQAMIKETRGSLSLYECAQKMNYHPNYLSKVLKRDKGITFTELVAEERLAQAKYLLLATNQSVAEIAESLQYNNVQNFIRFFKKQSGVTPAAFRKAVSQSMTDENCFLISPFIS